MQCERRLVGEHALRISPQRKRPTITGQRRLDFGGELGTLISSTKS